MKKLLSIAFLLLLPFFVKGGNIATEVNKRQQSESFVNFAPFRNNGSNINIEVLKEVSSYVELGIDQITQGYLVNDKPKNIRINIPGLNVNVLLYRFDASDNLNVITSSGEKANLNEIVHYRGIIENDNNSVVCMSFTHNDITGVISNDNGNFVIGKLNGTQRYILYNDRDLLLKRNFECGTTEEHVIKSKTEPSSQFIVGLKCINWYYETDYDIFVNKGSVANVTSYIQGMFAQVATLYANDSMNIKLKTLFVWNTVDPYNATTTSSLLTQFGQTRTSFDGDLAHLLGYVGNGGIAYVNSMCSSSNQYKMAYSDINPTYSLVPTYSWTIECVSHEQGHNVASKHTHDCAWNGNNTPIDGCGPAAGYTTNCTAGPLPSGGGTIMSYCHLVSGVGINFNLGFSPQPKALMKNTIAAKTCLFTCDTVVTPPPPCTTPAQPSIISGSVNPCVGVTGIYSVTSDPNATSYTWQLPSGWAIQTGTSTNTNSVSITAGSGSGNIAVFAVNSCGTSSPRTLYVTPSTVPATPGVINGPTGVCKNQAGVVYTTPLVTNATSYTWTVPTGSVITSGQGTNTITVTFGTRKGRVSVKANNSCGSSATKSINVNITCRETNFIVSPNFEVLVFPNPANEMITVNIFSKVNDSFSIELVDLMGRTCYKNIRTLEIGENKEVIDLSSNPSGVYLLEIINDGIKYTNKIIIE